jgi:hypothetical protein
MKKLIVTLSLFVTLAVASVYAQSAANIMVNIPFDFGVGNTILPAGQYTVEPIRSSLGAELGSLLVIRSADGRARAMVQAMPIQVSAIQTQAKLVFNRYGGQYFLSEVWSSGRSVGHELLMSHVERELAKNGSRRQTALLIRHSR